MKSKTLVLLAVALLLVVGSQGARAEDAKPIVSSAGFKSLFNGHDLTGWDGLPGFWSVKEGVLSGAETKQHPAPMTFLIYTPAKFSDFELHYKYKFATPAGNSGVQFRSKILDAKQRRVGGYQADSDATGHNDGIIYDEDKVAGNRRVISGRGERTTWDVENKRHDEPLAQSDADLKNFVKQGDWNDVVLMAQKNHITETINGHLMTDLTDNSPNALQAGVIALQLHPNFDMEIQFKDIEIKDLSAGGRKKP